MKVLALGGCGGMGRYAVETAHEFECISSITVADLDFDRAEQYANGFDHRVSAAQVDVTNEKQLKELMENHDVVLSTVGPYYLFGTLVLNAAIETQTHYIDICDDWEPTLEMFELRRKAEEAGITAIIGAGASPGISNMLAARAIAELERVDEVYTTWGSGGSLDDSEGDLEISDAAGEPTAATIHWLQQLTGEIRDQQSGACVASKPLTKEEISYPGIGKVECYSVGHPEPLTLPLYFDGIRRSKNLMNMPGYIIYVLKTAASLVDKKGASIKEAAQLVIDKLEKEDSATLKDSAAYVYHQMKDAGRKFLPGITALAIGQRNKRPLTVSAHIEGKITDGSMGASTCVPSAIFLKMLVDGRIKKRGVVAPEGCADPEEFFRELSPYVSYNAGFDAANYLVVRQESC